MKITALRRFASAVTLLTLMASATAFAQQSSKPNVVFILADNVGYGDALKAVAHLIHRRSSDRHWTHLSPLAGAQSGHKAMGKAGRPSRE